MLQTDIDQFILGYKIAAMWSSVHMEDENDNCGTPFDQLDPEPEWSEEALNKITEDCKSFWESNEEDLELYMKEISFDPSQGTPAEYAGHDFWLTRCGHGAGFWDRGLDELGDRLTEACKAYGSLDLYVGDDGQIYAM
jgi:hypothetical protein